MNAISFSKFIWVYINLNFIVLSQVAQTRLENRTYRPNVELCRDAAQFQLCHEVREIEGTVKALVEKLTEAQNAHHSLTDNLRHIEEDLAVKVNSYFVYDPRFPPT